MNNNYSVLMSVYVESKPTELNDCLISIIKQSPNPNEIVIVVDGPINKKVQTLLNHYSKNKRIRLLEFVKNRGLGLALRDGLAVCKNEYVARMDTDDICMDGRFTKQLQYLDTHPNVGVVGGALKEVYQYKGVDYPKIRLVSYESSELEKKALYRNPLNHQTVMFRKSTILDVGSYQKMSWFEDYYLWVRVIISGNRIDNIKDTLVRTTLDDNYFRRRGGLRYILRELALAKKFRRIGFHGVFQSIRFLVVRILFRMTPAQIRSLIYMRFLRN